MIAKAIRVTTISAVMFIDGSCVNELECRYSITDRYVIVNTEYCNFTRDLLYYFYGDHKNEK
jgi:hypothetical protein